MKKEQSVLEDWTEHSISFTKFRIFASIFDLELQSNNVSMEILNLLFVICKQASEGQVGAFFSK